MPVSGIRVDLSTLIKCISGSGDKLNADPDPKFCRHRTLRCMLNLFDEYVRCCERHKLLVFRWIRKRSHCHPGILRPVSVLLQNTSASAKGAAREENPRRQQGSAESRRWRRREYVQHLSGAYREKGSGTVFI
jgi:hypothetical protein